MFYIHAVRTIMNCTTTHAGEEEELEQYYNDYLGPSDHESSGSTCSTAYDCKDP